MRCHGRFAEFYSVFAIAVRFQIWEIHIISANAHERHVGNVNSFKRGSGFEFLRPFRREGTSATFVEDFPANDCEYFTQVEDRKLVCMVAVKNLWFARRETRIGINNFESAATRRETVRSPFTLFPLVSHTRARCEI